VQNALIGVVERNEHVGPRRAAVASAGRRLDPARDALLLHAGTTLCEHLRGLVAGVLVQRAVFEVVVVVGVARDGESEEDERNHTGQGLLHERRSAAELGSSQMT